MIMDVHDQIKRLKRDNVALLASLKEMRDAAAAMMRVIAVSTRSIDEMEREFLRVGIKDGFGSRAQNAIGQAEKE